MSLKQKILKAAKAYDIPCAWSGLWFIRKRWVKEPEFANNNGREVVLPPDEYKMLFRVTDSTMHLNVPGDCVMNDTPHEILTHMNFMLRAHGRVLITGLGLGCVVRGCLVNPNVKEIVCIEKEIDVLKLVLPYMPERETDRLKIIHADAHEWVKENKTKFDCAWHDLWSDIDNGEEALDVQHVKLIESCSEFVDYQGAWALNREIKKGVKRFLGEIA